MPYEAPDKHLTMLHLLPIEDFVAGETFRSLVRLGESGFLTTGHRGHANILSETEICYQLHIREPSTYYIMTIFDFEEASGEEQLGFLKVNLYRVTAISKATKLLTNLQDSTQFHYRLDDIPDCGLSNIGFITSI